MTQKTKDLRWKVLTVPDKHFRYVPKWNGDY